MTEYAQFDEFIKVLDSVVRSNGTKRILEALSRAMLLSCNQKQEFRFLHLAAMALEFGDRSAESPEQVSLARLLAAFDEVFGPTFVPQEVDFIHIPFISWVDWNGQTYRSFSGTFAESELHLSDLLSKGESLDTLLRKKFGFCFSELAELILPRIHRYIQQSGLHEQESVESAMSSSGLQEASASPAQTSLWEECFVIQRATLTEPQVKLLSRLSRRPGQYSANLEKLFGEQSDLMRFPVVKYADEFVIVCPQLVIPAFIHSVTAELARNHTLTQCILSHFKARLLRCLRRKFSTEPAIILPDAAFHGERLADAVVLFDRKVLLFSIAADDVERLTKQAASHVAVYERLMASEQRLLESNDRQIRIGHGPLEVLHFFILDSFREIELGIPESVFPAGAIAETISMKSLEYVLTDTSDALHFIKFFRMRARARKATKAILEVGRPILDAFAIFKQQSWLNPLAPGRPTLLVEVHSFAKYYMKQLLEYRKSHELQQLDTATKRWDVHYPNCLQRFDNGEITSLVALGDISIVIHGKCPTEETPFKTWHVSMDSICYHLGTNADRWKPLLNDKLPGVSRLTIVVSYEPQAQLPVAIAVSRDGPVIQVDVQVSPATLRVFASGDNSGERMIVGTLLTELGLMEQASFDAILPAAKARHLQLRSWRVPHQSWEHAPEAVPLYECDEEITITAERELLLKTGKKPGLYKTKSEIYDVLGVALKALREQLNVRVATFDRDMLVTFSYTQLEVAYISNEVNKQELAVASETAEFVDVEQEYIDTVKKGVNLTFAIRLVLETALQDVPGGDLPVTLEAFSELTAFANQVMLLDSLGDQLGALERAGSDLPVIELTARSTITIHQEGARKDDLPKFLFELQKSDLEQSSQKQEVQEEKKELAREFANTFDDALIDEYGFSMRERLALDAHIMHLFSDREVPIASMRVVELVEVLTRKSGLPEQTVRCYVERLTLSSDLLQGKGPIKPSERYWRDARVLNRPLVSIDGENILFAHTIVGLSSQVFAERLMKARCPSDSVDKDSQLAKAISKWANDRGEDFKNKLAAFLQNFEWKTHPEVRSLGDVSMPAKGMGPLDLVCIHRAKKRLLFLEAKQNYFSRSAKDLRNELDYYFGHGDEKGEFQRFTEKVEWAHSHEAQLVARFELGSLSDWSVESLFVTSELLYCAAFRTPPCTVMTESQFRTVIARPDMRIVGPESVKVPTLMASQTDSGSRTP
jgi:hypothetical protein